MSKATGPTKVQKSKASKNSLYMTTFIILIMLIFGLPTGAYLYMANTHKPTTSTQTDKQVQKIEQKKLPKPTKAKEENSDSSDTSSTAQQTSSTQMTSSTLNNDDYYAAKSSSQSVTPRYSSASRNAAAADSGSTYTVQQGDNLYRIAVNHGLTQQELMDLNGLTEPVVSVGQVLQVK